MCQTLAGGVTLDDGTGEVEVAVGLGPARPGLRIDTVQLGSYVLAIGKLVARKQGGGTHLNIKAQKVGACGSRWLPLAACARRTGSG